MSLPKDGQRRSDRRQGRRQCPRRRRHRRAGRDAHGDMIARFPKLEIVSSFGVGYDHIDFK